MEKSVVLQENICKKIIVQVRKFTFRFRIFFKLKKQNMNLESLIFRLSKFEYLIILVNVDVPQHIWCDV